MGHIELARWADLVVVAPATAHFMACLAQGLAPNLLTTLCLAVDAPHPAGARHEPSHVAAIRPRSATSPPCAPTGDASIGPTEGSQACGDVGPGRMAEPEELLASSRRLLSHPCLRGLDVLVTAGPTQEAWGPPFATYPITVPASRATPSPKPPPPPAPRTTLVSGPCSLPAPAGVQRIAVTSAQQMHAAVLAKAPSQALVIGVAAVADYRPASPAEQKIKKDANGQGMTLSLVENPDIIGAVAALPNRPVVVGFAAETQSPLANAQQKRVRKGLDAIVVNDVADRAIGFNSNENAATLIWANGPSGTAATNKGGAGCGSHQAPGGAVLPPYPSRRKPDGASWRLGRPHSAKQPAVPHRPSRIAVLDPTIFRALRHPRASSRTA